MAVIIETELQLDAAMTEPANPSGESASTGSPETTFLQPNKVEASDSTSAEAAEEDPLGCSVSQKESKSPILKEPPDSDGVEKKPEISELNLQNESSDKDSSEGSNCKTTEPIAKTENKSQELEPVSKGANLESVKGRIKVVPFSSISDSPELCEEKSENSLAHDQVEVKVEKLVEPEVRIKDEVTDEDVLNGLNALESCFENSPEHFLDGLIDNSEDIKDRFRIKEESQLEEGEIPPRSEEFETIEQMSKDEKLQLIYSEKFKSKELVAKKRLQSFAKTLVETHPVYKELMEKVEKEHGMSFCKLEESKHAPWNVRHTNRWKLKCNKLVVREDDPQLLGPRNERPIRRIEYCLTSGADGSDLDQDPTFPPFIVNIARKFEEFLNTNQLIQTFAIKNENVSGPKSEFTAMMLRANRENQVMMVVIGHYLKSEMLNALKKFITPLLIPHNVASLYCKSYSPQTDDSNSSATTFLLGQQYILETIGNIKIELTPRSNFWSNAHGLEVLVKTINNFFTPLLENTTLLEIGCGIGVMSLMFTSKYSRVIGVDSSSEINEAETNRQKNNNDKVLFLRENENTVQLFFDQLKKKDNVNAIINSNSQHIGRSTEVIYNIRKLHSIKRLVFLGSFNQQTINALLELMAPWENTLGNLPFVPVKGCIVDSIPDTEHFDIVMLMQRRAVRSQAQPESGPIEIAEIDEIEPEPATILENVKEQQKILEETTKKLATGNLSPELAADLRNLIETLKQKTNTLQTSLPLLASKKHSEPVIEPVKKFEPLKRPEPERKPDPPKDSGLVLEPGKSRKYQINLQPLEPSPRVVKRNRFLAKTLGTTKSQAAPPAQQIHIPTAPSRPRSPDWHSNSNSPPRHSRAKRLRPITPPCPPAFDLKKPGFVAPVEENWDDDDPVPPQPVIRREKREERWEERWDDPQPQSYHRQPGYREYKTKEYSPEFERHSRSPRRHHRSHSRSSSRSYSYCSRSRSRSRSYSRSRSRSRSPKSRRRRRSPHLRKRSSTRQKRSYRERDRYSRSQSPPAPVPPPEPVMVPHCNSAYMMNSMPMHMMMPVQMAQMQIPMKEQEIPWAPKEIEFSPSRMPVQVNPKVTEHVCSGSESVNFMTDTPMSPGPDDVKKETKVRDPRLRGKYNPVNPFSRFDEVPGQESGGNWVNGNGVAMIPNIVTYQQQLLNGELGPRPQYPQWMDFQRPGPSGVPPRGPYVMQQYGWGYPGAPSPAPGSSRAVGSQGPAGPMMMNGIPWQGPEFGPNYSTNSYTSFPVKEKK